MESAAENAISRRDATIAAAVSLLLGVFVSAVVLIGSDIPLKCFEAGNFADWVAAIGAWAVGLAALAFTVTTHRDKIRGELERDARERSTARARLTEVLASIDRVGFLAGVFSRFATLAPEEQSVSKFQLMARILISTSSTISWAQIPRRDLMPRQVEKLAELEFAVVRLGAFVELLLEEHGTRPTQSGGRTSVAKDPLVQGMSSAVQAIELLSGALRRDVVELIGRT